jgi:prevent-host-death family protein
LTYIVVRTTFILFQTMTVNSSKEITMKQLITIREANQHLSRYVDDVQDGAEIIITRRGLPVAKLSAFVESKELDDKQKDARKRSLARMRKGYPLGGTMPVRETLHER